MDYPFNPYKRILLCDLIFNTFSIVKVQIFGSSIGSKPRSDYRYSSFKQVQRRIKYRDA